LTVRRFINSFYNIQTLKAKEEKKVIAEKPFPRFNVFKTFLVSGVVLYVRGRILFISGPLLLRGVPLYIPIYDHKRYVGNVVNL
jgi:hypothetical protein